MTIDELNEFKYLGKLIEYKKECLENIRAADGDLERETEREIKELQEKKNRIGEWISQQPVKIRLIASLRFIDGLSWNEIADRVSLNFTESTSKCCVPMYFYNYLGRQAKAEKKQRRKYG